MKFSVGLQFENDAFIDEIIRSADSIGECYFSFGDIPNGRSSQLLSDERTPWEMQVRQEEVLRRVSSAGISLNLLFNANCYGEGALSRAFFSRVGMTVDYIDRTYGLSSVTTTSPLIAKFIKEEFPTVKTRASVNMGIGTAEGMDYLLPHFDSFYMQREYNRDFDRIKLLYAHAQKNGKTLHMLANSGCLNFCSAHTFHDNLVAHESGISAMNNYYEFNGICKEFLKNPENYGRIMSVTNFVRPEDIHLYEPYFVSAKLATRIHKHPDFVLRSYLRGRYSGNLLELLEPTHSIYPYVLENGNEPKIVKLDENL